MGAQIHFDPEGVKVQNKYGSILFLTLALEGEYKLFPQPAPSLSLCLFSEVTLSSPWGLNKKNPIGLAHYWASVLVQLNAEATPVWIRQYPMSIEDRMGITCMSPMYWRHDKSPHETCYRIQVSQATECLLRKPSLVNLSSPNWGTYSTVWATHAFRCPDSNHS